MSVMRITIALLALLFMINCGKTKNAARNSGANASSAINFPNQPVEISGCTSPIVGALRRLSPVSGDLTAGSLVSWELTMSGGCSSIYRIEGNNQTISSPFIFQKSYSQGASQRESLRLNAIYVDGRVNPSSQTILSDAFNVIGAPVSPLLCSYAANPSALSVPVDANGNVTGAQVPSVTFSLRCSRGGIAVPSRIKSLMSLNSSIPIDFSPSLLPMTADALNPQLPINIRKSGTHVFSMDVSSGDGTPNANQTTVVVVYNVTGVYTAPPVVQQFSASLNPVVSGGSTVFQWRITGSASQCRLKGLTRDYITNLPLVGSYEVLNILAPDTFKISCLEIESGPIAITVIPRPSDLTLSFQTDGRQSPNDSSRMLGLPVTNFFDDLGVSDGANYGAVFYAGLEVGLKDLLADELNLRTDRCSQGAQPYRTGINISDQVNFTSSSLLAPTGVVGVYAWGHGGATVNVQITTNYRTISLTSTYPRWEGNQSPFVFSNGSTVVIGLRSYDHRTFGATIDLVPGEYPINFRSSSNVFDNAGLGGYLWRVSCQ